MAIQQLDLKLDQMNQELVDEQQRQELADTPFPEQTVDMPASNAIRRRHSSSWWSW